VLLAYNYSHDWNFGHCPSTEAKKPTFLRVDVPLSSAEMGKQVNLLKNFVHFLS